MPGRTLTPMTPALLVGFFACLLFARPAMTLPDVPDGFTADLVTEVPQPTALAFTPDDRMLVASKTGQLYVYEGVRGSEDPLQKIRALNIGSKVCSGDTERGLLGVAVDPNFANNGYVYLVPAT
jgi:hypothetical protein